MSDTTTDVTDEAQEAETGAEDSTTDDSRISKANQEAARYRKELRAAQAELDKVRKAGLTEQEKAVAEAKTAGATEAARAAAPRLVKAELRAAAADAGLTKESLAGFLEYADLSRFVGDDGEVDEKAIGAAIKKLGGGKPADFDGGARTPAAKATDMNSLIRQRAGLS